MVCISCVLLPLGLLLLSYARTILDVVRELLGFGGATTDATAANASGPGKKPLIVNLAAHEWAKQHVLAAESGGDAATAAVDESDGVAAAAVASTHDDDDESSDDDAGLRNRAATKSSVPAQ